MKATLTANGSSTTVNAPAHEYQPLGESGERPSLAVMPFSSRSGLPEDEALPNNAEVEAQLRSYQAEALGWLGFLDAERSVARLAELGFTILATRGFEVGFARRMRVRFSFRNTRHSTTRGSLEPDSTTWPPRNSPISASTW